MKHTILNLVILCGILFPAITVSASAVADGEATAGNHLMLRHHDAKDTLDDGLSSNGDIRSLTTTPLPIRLNAGGSAFIDDEGNQWEPDDAYANTGRKWKTTETIEHTPNQDLYQTERWDKLGGKRLKYIFEVPNGHYRVKLHFSENYANAGGERVFHIWVQGIKKWLNVDIFSGAGGKFKPYVRERAAKVTDGTLVITFQHITGNPKVNGIEILPNGGLIPSEDYCIKRTVDFSQTALEESLEGGTYVSTEWNLLGMELLSSGGYETRPRLLNSSNVAGSQDVNLGTPNERCTPSGPGIGEGGEPGMPGESCASQGNVLIIQDPSGNVTIPSANENGGKISFEFRNFDFVNVNEIGLLNIDDKTSISLVVKTKGVGYRKPPPIDVPVLGDNSFQVVSVNATRIKRVEVNFSSSGAVTHISFCGKALSPYHKCVLDCPAKDCFYDCPSAACSLDENEGFFCASCNPSTNYGCGEREQCKNNKRNTNSSAYVPRCYLLGGESCSSSIDCLSDLCDPTEKICI